MPMNRRSSLPRNELLTWANIAGQFQPPPASFAHLSDPTAKPSPKRVKHGHADAALSQRSPNRDLVLLSCVHCNKAVLPESFSAHSQRCKLIRSGQAPVAAVVTPKVQAPKPVVAPDITPIAAPAELKIPSTTATLGQSSKLRNIHRGRSTDTNNAEAIAAATVLAKLPSLDQALASLPNASAIRQFATQRKSENIVIDLDKHCGVKTMLGTPCFQLLDCPVHSERSKAAVHGRSSDFNTLFMRMTGREVVTPPSSTIISFTETVTDSNPDITQVLEKISSCPPPLVANWHTVTKRQTNSLRSRDILFAILNHGRINAFSPTLATATVNKGNTRQSTMESDEIVPTSTMEMTSTAVSAESNEQRVMPVKKAAPKNKRKKTVALASDVSEANSVSAPAPPANPRRKSVKCASTVSVTNVQVPEGTMDPRDLKLM